MPIYISKDIDAENFATEFFLPVMDGIEAIHICNTNLTKAARNYAPGKAAAVVKGAPTVTSDYITCKGMADYLETRVQESRAQTIWIATRTSNNLTDADTRPMPIGTFTSEAAAGGGPTFGVMLAGVDQGSGPTMLLQASRGTNVSNDISGTATMPLENQENWSLFAALVKDASTKNEIYNLTANLHVTSGSADTPRFPSRGFYRIGSGYSSAYLGSCDIAFVAISSVAVTEAKILRNGDAIKAYLDTRGIAV